MAREHSKLLFLLTEDWFFCSHFIERAIAAQTAGYEVVVACRENSHGEQIREMGLKLVPVDFVRRSTNLPTELRTLREIFRLYRRERPDIIHQIGAKPILYGSLVARILGIRCIVNASIGMGYVFSSMDSRARRLKPLVSFAYRCLMNSPGSKVVFENGDDLATFVRMGAVQRKDAVLIRGAGIDVNAYQPHGDEPPGTPVVMLIARMLRDKGINEFVEAAHLLHEEGVHARFVLVGDPDPENPTSIPLDQLQAWSGVRGVEWWGWRGDVAEILAASHIACLPSYREGLPKSLLEAAASGLPIVTTDTVGCREVVCDGENGYLVPVGDPRALADALKKLINNPELRKEMGAVGRARAEAEFASSRVIAETLAVYGGLSRGNAK
jgi:glycosyltransferase involved in cell wall biosynthesis